MTVGHIFQDEQQDDFGTWALGYSPYGGGDFGEVVAIANAVGAGDDTAFYDAWVAAGDRLVAEGDASLAQGHRESARDVFLRASSFYASSYHPLYGEPVDPRLVAAFRKQTRALDRGLALSNPPIQGVRIPFEGTTLPGYVIPALGREADTRPLLILTNGYDASATDLYFASAVAASRRGYHCLIFDGPGQGEMLIEHGMRLRPDWEAVVAPVVDFALTLPNVDRTRVALAGWSLGGYLALRAASGEHRLAACIADPGLTGMRDGLQHFATMLGVSPAVAADPQQADDATLAAMSRAIAANRKLRWTVVQRGYWVQGVNTLRDFLTSAATYTMDDRTELVRCPTLLTMAEKDPLAAGVPALYAALRCPKTLVRFTAAEGAGDHCELMNRSAFNRRALDWLDVTLASR